MSLVASLNTGVSALNTYSKGIQVIANDIANVSSTAYKESRAEYSDNFYNYLQQAAPSSTSGLGSNVLSKQMGTGVQVASITADFGQGTLSSTGRNEDFAISGNGFFRVRDSLSGNEFATRAGDFRIDDQGYLVTNQGFRIQGLMDGAVSYSAIDDNGSLSFVKTETAPTGLGDIKIDYTSSVGAGVTNDTGGTFTDEQVNAARPTMRSFTVDRQGNLIIGLSNGDTFNRGKLLLQNFNDPDALTRAGNNLYTGFEAAGPLGGVNLTAENNSAGTNGLGSIEIGTLELSNVDLSKEFSEMIVSQRSFQAGSRIITVSDTLLEEVINLKR